MRKSGRKKVVRLMIPAIALTTLPAISTQGFQGSTPVVKNQKRQLHKMARISILQAIDIAVSQFEGTPVEAEIEIQAGFLVYEIELSGGMKVIVDAGNGDILKNESDNDNDDDNDHDDDNDNDNDDDDDNDNDNDDDDDNDNDDDDDDDNDHDDDKESHISGGAKLSLKDAIKAALSAKPGTVVEAELEGEHGQLAYCIEIVDASDRGFEVEVDARTGKVGKINAD